MAEKELLKKKIQARNGHRLVVRKTITKAREIVPPPKEITPIELRPQLESLKSTLQRKRDIITPLDDEISDLLDEENIEKEIVDRSQFEEDLEEMLCRIEHALKTQNVNNEPRQHSLEVNQSIDKVKLPKLPLLMFNGDPTQWTPFWESFESTIHISTNLANIDKFKYLQGSLTGDVAQTIAGLPLSGENYSAAVELLNKRFGNRQIIISRHIEGLMDLPKVTKENDLRSLRQLYDKTESTVRSLKGIGITTESYGTLLTPIIMSKIPPEMRLLVSRQLKDEWDLDGTLKILGEELSLREKCAYAPINATSGFNGMQATKTKTKTTPESTTATFMVENENVVAKSNNSVPFCLFCGKQHYSSSCNSITNPDTRKRILREKKRCFVCLRAGHISRNCRSNSKCFHYQGRHHATICGAKIDKSPICNDSTRLRTPVTAAQPNVSVNRSANSNVSTLITSDHVNNTSILLQTAKAKVHRVDNPDNEIVVRLILDSCSQKSYVSTRLRDRLQLPTVKTEKVIIKEFGNKNGTLKTCESVQLAIKGADNLTVYINAFVVDTICSPISNQSIDVAKSHYLHLQNLPLADRGDGNESMEIDILVGADYLWNFMLDNVVRGEQGFGPVATLTRFGYVLSGPVHVPSQNEHSSNITIAHVLRTDTNVVNRNEELKNEIHSFWSRESLRKPANEVTTTSKDNPLSGKIEFNGTGYEVTLPLVENDSVIADNYTVALKRVQSLHQRLRRKPDILDRYDAVIKEQLEARVVEIVPKGEEHSIAPGSVYYNPHREVIKEERSTTKLRVVYDASSKRNGEKSLNECLDPGPNLAPLVYDILLRFRVCKFALVGDLEKAFLSIGVNPKQRDLLRFLWFDDITKDNPEVTILRFTRLVFGLTCSPFVLNQTIRHHLNQYKTQDPLFVSTVKKSLYVDDFAFSMNSEDECFELYTKLKSCFAEGGFNMRKWATNSTTLEERIKKQEEKTVTISAKTIENNNNCANLKVSVDNTCFSETISNAICDNDEIKVLGIPWNRNKDNLKYEFSNFVTAAENKSVTKRTVLSTTARFFDPIGLLSPVIVPLKVIFQKICQLKIDWDDILPPDISNEWLQIVKNIAKVKSIDIPRFVLRDVLLDNNTAIQLHGFCDASQHAYGACIYLRIETQGVVEIRLITAKTHIAPQKGETIPRLELMAAVLAQLITNVRKVLKNSVKIKQCFCWSDSQVVLHWIYSNKKQKQLFVLNRVRQITSLVNKESWGYCPTNQNPADIASRGIECPKIVDNRIWWKGPLFLQQDYTEWPKFEFAPSQEPDVNSSVNTFITVSETSSNGLQELINCNNYSNINKLIRVTAYVLKFIELLKTKRGQAKSVSGKSNETDQYINKAKRYWHKEVQKSFYKDPKFKETERNLGTFVDNEGIIRVGGRLQNAPLPYSTKYPVLLPRNHHFTALVISRAHETVKHNGVNETLTEIRSEYWVCKGRQIVKTMLSKCVRCKEITGKPYATPKAPPLPSYRVSEELAFTCVAIDFAGPLYVKDIYKQDGPMHKCYIALFSCASTRALHLELVPDLHAPTFIRALKRMMSRRGLSSIIISDNGSTFRDKNVQRYSQSLSISWKFNVPTASWWGGFWEICVKLVKRCLKKTLRNAKLTYEELETALIEVEGILNSRPLTYVSEEITEPPLSPSILVIGRRILDKQIVHYQSSIENTYKSLTKRARYLETLLSHFRNRFKTEYLPSLREHHKVNSTNKKSIVAAGDIVHLYKEKLPRQSWPMGKIIKLLPGKDGITRAAEVKTVTPSKDSIIVKRPIQKLFPIEVRSNETPTENTSVENQSRENTSIDNQSEVEIKMVTDEDVTQHIVGH